MNKRETIVEHIFNLLKSQRTVKLGKVDRDPIIPEELPRTGFPAAFIQTTDEDIEDLSVGGLRNAVMSCNIVVYVNGESRDKQRNIAVSAIEDTLMADRSLENTVRDIALTRVESIELGEAAPYASFRMIFTIEYCYNLTEE